MNVPTTFAITIILITWTISRDFKVMASSSSLTETILVWLNHTLELKCQVEEEDYERLVWKKGDDLLTVGSVVFTPDPRVYVTKLGRLRLEDAQINDGGKYSCQMGGRAPQSEKFTFEVYVEEFKCLQLSPPNNGQILFRHVNGQKPFTNGSLAIYTCDHGYALKGPAERRCTETYTETEGWEGDQPLCLPEELRLLEDRLIQLEKHLLLSDQLNSTKLYEHEKNGETALSKTRLQRLENETGLLLRKQTELRDWTMREIHILQSSVHQEPKFIPQIGTSKLEQLTRKLDNVNSSLQLLYDQLEAKVAKMEKTIKEGAINLKSSRFAPSTTVVTNTELSGPVISRLASLENESKALSQIFREHLRLLQYVNSVNAISQTWEETQRQMVARFEINENGELFWQYLWIVHNFEVKLKKSLVRGTSQFSTQSNAFYTGVPGYRLRLVLYPNFDGSGQLGLFTGLLPGEFDDQIVWPFNYDYHLAVVSHDPKKAKDHVGVINMPPTTCDLSNFQRPFKGDPPSACGFRFFMSHEMLNDKKTAYITHGHLWVRIRIFV